MGNSWATVTIYLVITTAYIMLLQKENDKEFFNLLRYLKCEMYNPQYTARFAVIMEAYLKACGKSMLVGYYSSRVVCPLTRQWSNCLWFFFQTKFEEQVKIQATLENIGKQVYWNWNTCLCPLFVWTLLNFWIEVVWWAWMFFLCLQLKERCDGEHAKMQEMLPTLLETVGASKFTAVYNPRSERLRSWLWS